jgi:hypothetical protein
MQTVKGRTQSIGSLPLAVDHHFRRRCKERKVLYGAYLFSDKYALNVPNISEGASLQIGMHEISTHGS